MATPSCHVTKPQVFTLEVGPLHPDDDPSAVLRLARELERIVEDVNVAVIAAREDGGRVRSVSIAARCCATCAGLGQALGECAECVGTGRAT